MMVLEQLSQVLSMRRVAVAAAPRWSGMLGPKQRPAQVLAAVIDGVLLGG